MADTTEAERQCAYYGSFMHELSRPQAEAMYWCLFVFVLCLLFSASWYYGRVMERIEHLRVGDRKRQRMIHWCFYKTLVCGFFGLAAAVIEVFVLLTLQFCDQEPLASLYWSNWTVLQVGAVVAMFGICLHVRHMIKGRRHPPWALALGTPVLVVAGLGHYFQGKVKNKARSVGRNLRSRSRSRRSRGRSRDEPLSKAPTVRDASTNSGDRSPTSDDDTPTVYTEVSDNFNAKVVGYTKEGDIIIRLAPSLSSEFNTRVKRQSGSIRWDESTPRIHVLKADAAYTPMTPRAGSPKQQLSASTTLKDIADSDTRIGEDEADVADRRFDVNEKD